MTARTRSGRSPARRTYRSRAAVDRRIIERRRQVVRDRVRRRRRGLAVIVAGGLLALGLWRLSNSSLFGLSGVSVTGVDRLTSAQVVRASGVLAASVTVMVRPALSYAYVVVRFNPDGSTLIDATLPRAS